jgi:tetratricopeptide (TPR) repeat protein
MEKHRYDEAESLCQRALQLQESTLGSEHPAAFRTLSHLATTDCSAGRFQEAEPLYLRAIEVGEQCLGAAHPDVVATLSNYAALLRKLHRKGEALKLEARARVTQQVQKRESGEIRSGLERVAKEIQLAGRLSVFSPG